MTYRSDSAPIATVDQELFRQVVGHFASGVTVITTSLAGELYGTTASAVSSLSMDPPMMLMCLNHTSSTHDAVLEAGTYAINILAEDQRDIAVNFGRKSSHKFEGVDYSISSHGDVPLIDNALATLVCTVTEAPRGGTHSVFFGRVVEATYREGNPLAYYRGTFGRLEHVRELEAYARVRQWVLSRNTPLHEELRLEVLQEQLHCAPEDILNALVRLSTEGLVTRSNSGSYVPVPVTVEVSDSFYDGRAAIAKGVVASKLEDFSSTVINELTDIAVAMGQLRNAQNASLDDYLQLHSDFHRTLIAQSGSPQLVDSYQRLSIAGLWRDAWSDQDWRTVLDHTHLATLAEALQIGDLTQAMRAITSYTNQAKEYGQLAIEQHGGEV